MRCLPELVQPRLSAPALRVQAQKQVNVSVVGVALSCLGGQRPPLHHEPAGSVFAVSAVRGDKLARSSVEQEVASRCRTRPGGNGCARGGPGHGHGQEMRCVPSAAPAQSCLPRSPVRQAAACRPNGRGRRAGSAPHAVEQGHGR